MNLYFLPGELHLKKQEDSSYLITIQGIEILCTRSEKKAIAEFNKIRKDMESRFPPHELSSEEKTKLLLEYISKDHSTYKGLPRRKYKSGSTNTFG